MSKKPKKPKYEAFRINGFVIVDAETRPLTAVGVVMAGAASVAFNVWGASMLYDEFPARLFFVILAMGLEFLAFMVVKGIIDDWRNNHREKAGVAAGLLVCIAIVCATFGHAAFERLSIDRSEKNAAETRRAERVQDLADEYFADAAAFKEEGKTIHANKARRDAEDQQAIADRILIDVKKQKELPPIIRLLILFVAETVKIGGRYVFATRTASRWSKGRRKSFEESAAQKAAEEAAKPKRGRPKGVKNGQGKAAKAKAAAAGESGNPREEVSKIAA